MQRSSLVFIILGLLFMALGSARAQTSAQHRVLPVTDPSFDPENDTGFYYTIQRGDTLWDLSQKFYNSQWDWPGLWELNRNLKNPHWIYPGNKIKIFLKKGNNPAVTAQALEKKLPEDQVIPRFSYSGMSRVGFITQQTQTSLGRILKGKEGNLMMSTHDIIYIKPSDEGTLVPEKIYQVFSTQKVDKKIGKNRFNGIKHLIKADIRVIADKGEYVVAVILDSYREVNIGDRIMEYYSRNPVLAIQDTPDDIDAAIVCSEDDNLMINDYRIAFINQGHLQGIQPGQIFSVIQDNPLPGSDKRVNHMSKKETPQLDPIIAGRLIVLHTEELFSTIMVLSSDRDIHPGDRVR